MSEYDDIFPAAIKNSGEAHIAHAYSDQVAYNNVILKLLEKVWFEGRQAGLDEADAWAQAEFEDEDPQNLPTNPYTRPGFEDAT